MTTATNVERKQGDTYPIAVTILKDDGTAHDLTGVTEIKIGVSVTKTNESPADATHISVGTVTDAASGTASFPVTAGMAALTVGKYYAEIQFTQSTYIRTTNSFDYKVIGQIITS